MATLQSRNGSHRLRFRFDGKQQALTIGAVPLTEAGSGRPKSKIS
jgi:hypothetical protein